MASFFVVVTHLCRAWNYDLWFPRQGDEFADPSVLQLPFIRLPWQGRIGVTMFAFLTGYVCAIKPLRQVKSGNLSGALTTLGKSAFRRPPRLILPATLALLISWAFAQIGGFTVSQRCDSLWLRETSPHEIGNLYDEVHRLFRNFQMTWTEGHMEYDDHQWALLPLLQGAFTIYVTLFATCFMKVRYRMLTVVVLFLWYWNHIGPEKGKRPHPIASRQLTHSNMINRDFRVPISLRRPPLRHFLRARILRLSSHLDQNAPRCSNPASCSGRLRCWISGRASGVGWLVTATPLFRGLYLSRRSTKLS